MACQLSTRAFVTFVLIILLYSCYMVYIVYQTYFMTEDEFLSHLQKHEDRGNFNGAKNKQELKANINPMQPQRVDAHQNVGEKVRMVTPENAQGNNTHQYLEEGNRLFKSQNTKENVTLNNTHIHSLKADKDENKKNGLGKTENREDGFKFNNNTAYDEELLRMVSHRMRRSGNITFINDPGREWKRYVVVGATVHEGNYNYVFPLPIDVYVWQRIGFQTIVIIAGEFEVWIRHPVLGHTLIALLDANASLVFIPSEDKHKIMLSQTARLFAACLFEWRHADESFLMVSDADLWPIDREFYQMDEKYQILSLNSECCGTFQHKGQRYKMLPMCNIGMTVKTWREVMRFEAGDMIVNASGILDYLSADFGEFVFRPIEKGENDGWFLDQHLVSIRISQWSQSHPNAIEWVRRDTSRDRIDRSYGWWPWRLEGHRDAHILDHGYNPGVWERLRPLLHLIFNTKSATNRQLLAKLEEYRSGFLQAMYSLTTPG